MSKKTAKPPVAALAIAALGVDLADDSAGAAADDFRLIPAGSFRSRDGRPVECAAWVLTPEDGARIVRL